MQKQELENRLDEYHNILRDNILEYLQSLINLDYSVVNSNICDHDRGVLNELDIYKYITAYNIYYRALNILKKYEPISYQKIDDDTGILATVSNVYGIEEYVFRLIYNHGVSNISLYKRIFDGDMRKETSYLRKKGIIYLDKIKRLESLPSREEQYGITNSINEEFMDDYGLTNRDFSVRENSRLNKVLTLERPGIKIKQSIISD